MDKCFLCKSKERDDVKFGDFMTHGEISVHYFCLLLTSNLMQRGRDDEGFLGFLEDDIKNEAKRVALSACCYCKKKSANISCCARKCRKTFHLTCGIENDAENQFVGTFKSYCDRHVTGKKSRRPPLNETCCICYESIIGEKRKFSCVTMLRAPCCKNGWFHKWCLAAFAKSAGYFFKCPLCNDNKVFRQRLVYKGVFIPDRDAAWELEPNAFADLLERPNKCSAQHCNFKGGRNAYTSRNKFIFCGTCGSVAIHRQCIKLRADIFYCDECIPVIEAAKNTSIINITSTTQMKNNYEEEEEDIDVCGEDDLDNLKSSDLEKTTGPLFENPKNNNSDDIITDSKDFNITDNGILNRGHKMVQQTSTLDMNRMNVDVIENRVVSCDAKSCFDSEMKDDHSCNRGFNLYAKLSTCNLHILGITKTQTDQNFKRKQFEKINKPKTIWGQFSSSHDFAYKNQRTVGLTRRQSMCAKTHCGVENIRESHPIPVRRKSELTPISLATFTSDAKNKATASLFESGCCKKSGIFKEESSYFKSFDISTLGTNHNVPEDDDIFNVYYRALPGRQISINESVDSKNITSESNIRPRSNSEDLTKSSFALRRTQYRRFSHCSYTKLQDCRRNSSTELLTPVVKKRSRSNSLLSKITMQNKKHKKNNTLVENENSYQDIDMTHEGHASIARTPLSSNLCSLYAFITPSYVRKNESNKRDTSSVTACQNVSMIPEVDHIITKNLSNILLLKNGEADQSAVKTDSSKTSNSNPQKIKTGEETFPQSYSLLIHSQKKSKLYKPRNKRISDSFSEQNLTSSQTRIESFFQRI